MIFGRRLSISFYIYLNNTSLFVGKICNYLLHIIYDYCLEHLFLKLLLLTLQRKSICFVYWYFVQQDWWILSSKKWPFIPWIPYMGQGFPPSCRRALLCHEWVTIVAGHWCDFRSIFFVFPEMENAGKYWIDNHNIICSFLFFSSHHTVLTQSFSALLNRRSDCWLLLFPICKENVCNASPLKGMCVVGR